ncbi:MAG: hypothetical protein HC906_12460 [Bacteroidales bacterium]|nr:hypothetical protein [Bacteroidales bacterium]
MEFRIPFSNLYDKDFNPVFAEVGKEFGFDITIPDQDEGITESRHRMVWKSDGSNGGTEAWFSMKDAGRMALADSTGFADMNDTILCDSTEIASISFNIDEESVQNHQWITDGSILTSDKTHCLVKWNESGIKEVKLIYENLSGESKTLKRTVIIYPKISVTLIPSNQRCVNSVTTLATKVLNGNPPFKYFWNGILGDSVYYPLWAGNQVNLKVVDKTGCRAISSYYAPYDTFIMNIPEIYMVTVDSKHNKNKIIWCNPGNTGFKENQVMKETTVAYEFSQIGTLPGNKNFFIDMESDPSREANRYSINSVDSCDNIYTGYNYHQPIHLQVSQGLQGNLNLSWSPYSGFYYGTYYIYKGNTKNSMVLFDSVASTITQYTDKAIGVKYYQVAVRRNSPCGFTTNPRMISAVLNPDQISFQVVLAEVLKKIPLRLMSSQIPLLTN